MCETGPNEGDEDGPGGAVTPEAAAAMLRTVLKLFDRWGLSNGQKAVLLGGVSALDAAVAAGRRRPHPARHPPPDG